MKNNCFLPIEEILHKYPSVPLRRNRDRDARDRATRPLRRLRLRRRLPASRTCPSFSRSIDRPTDPFVSSVRSVLVWSFPSFHFPLGVGAGGHNEDRFGEEHRERGRRIRGPVPEGQRRYPPHAVRLRAHQRPPASLQAGVLLVLGNLSSSSSWNWVLSRFSIAVCFVFLVAAFSPSCD